MVMEEEYGRDQMRKFLKLESDRYQRSRGGEDLKEVPLLEVENQGYIHYNKGSVVLYWLREFVGEDSLEQGLPQPGGHLRLRRAALPHRAGHVPRTGAGGAGQPGPTC
jgi:ABC-2 type transport system permease protein